MDTIYRNKYIEKFIKDFFNNGITEKNYKGRTFYKDEFERMLETAYDIVRMDSLWYMSDCVIAVKALKMVFDFYDIDNARIDKRLINP